MHPTEINYEEEFQICKKRDSVSNECLKMDPITDRDVKRLELYTLTIACLYYCALSLPFIVPAVYTGNIWFKVRDTKNKFDERIFAAT